MTTAQLLAWCAEHWFLTWSALWLLWVPLLLVRDLALILSRTLIVLFRGHPMTTRIVVPQPPKDA